MMAKYRIVFAGTPAFALPSLQACLDSEHEVCAVYTQKDRPKGRGQVVTPSPVKVLAQQANIPVHTPDSCRDPAVLTELAAYKPDILIVVAYGMLLPQSILDIPRLTCLNVHASLLPRWRGAAPINHAIMAGDAETGVSIMQVVKALDAGPVYKTARYLMAADDTAATVYDALASLGGQALVETLSDLPLITPQPQYEALVTYAHKLQKADGQIDFALSAVDIERRFRGLQPWPGCFFWFRDQAIKVHEMVIDPSDKKGPPGTILSWDERGLCVATGSQPIYLQALQFPGKQRLAASILWQQQPKLFATVDLLR